MDPIDTRPLRHLLRPQDFLPAPRTAAGIHDMLVISQCPDLTPEFPASLRHLAATRRMDVPRREGNSSP
jgi:hypothetical protein